MRIRLNGDKWNKELRKNQITDADKKCWHCGCEFDYKDHDVETLVSVTLHQKRGVVKCPCCGEYDTLWSKDWDPLEPLWRRLDENYR